jgi:hypothetical protein
MTGLQSHTGSRFNSAARHAAPVIVRDPASIDDVDRIQFAPVSQRERRIVALLPQMHAKDVGQLGIFRPRP